MKAWLVETEDSERRYFARWIKAEAYCQEWAKEYARDTASTPEKVRAAIGPRPKEIEIEE